MTQVPLLASSPSIRRLLLVTLLGLPLAGACSDDEETAAPPVDLTLTISALDGGPPDQSEPLRCDGTLAVQVDIAPPRGFTLRPPHACGTSLRCGYVHVEARGSDDQVLASVDTVTTLGLLELDADELSRLATISAVLLRGVDQLPVQNLDRSEVATSLEVNREVPVDCPSGGGGAGSGGAPGAAGGAAEGGASGSPAGGAASAGGASGGAPNSSETAGAGGAATDSNAGSGGV